MHKEREIMKERVRWRDQGGDSRRVHTYLRVSSNSGWPDITHLHMKALITSKLRTYVC